MKLFLKQLISEEYSKIIKEQVGNLSSLSPNQVKNISITFSERGSNLYGVYFVMKNGKQHKLSGSTASEEIRQVLSALANTPIDVPRNYNNADVEQTVIEPLKKAGFDASVNWVDNS